MDKGVRALQRLISKEKKIAFVGPAHPWARRLLTNIEACLINSLPSELDKVKVKKIIK